ncbi:MAG: hypothetical protein ACC742_15885, partial [Thermoanaerobaculales bacterium]
MINNRLTALIVTLAVVAAACSAGGSVATTSTAAPTTSSSSTGTPRTTTDIRQIETVDCDSPPEQVVIVCEAYELIQTHYVDQIDDATLASA